MTHGPVCIGATDSLYGTINIVASMRRLRGWARGVFLVEWIELAAVAVTDGRKETLAQ